MSLPAEALMQLTRPSRRVAYASRDTMHYALAVGMGGNELNFVYEANLIALPSIATMLSFDDSWLEGAGVDLGKVVHGSQHLKFLGALPSAGTVSVNFSIAGVIDKGLGRGTLIIQKTRLDNEETGEPVAVGRSTLFVRGEGGGGSMGVSPHTHSLPIRVPDRVILQPTTQNQALYFRLLGDFNPLHACPEAARKAGFDQPILHGSCTYGMACATILRTYGGLDPKRLLELEARFVGAVVPGETLVFLLWLDGDIVSFRAIVAERGITVLDNGRALVLPA
jgi:acyl dehydratase